MPVHKESQLIGTLMHSYERLLNLEDLNVFTIICNGGHTEQPRPLI